MPFLEFHGVAFFTVYHAGAQEVWDLGHLGAGFSEEQCPLSAPPQGDSLEGRLVRLRLGLDSHAPRVATDLPDLSATALNGICPCSKPVRPQWPAISCLPRRGRRSSCGGQVSEDSLPFFLLPPPRLAWGTPASPQAEWVGPAAAFCPPSADAGARTAKSGHLRDIPAPRKPSHPDHVEPGPPAAGRASSLQAGDERQQRWPGQAGRSSRREAELPRAWCTPCRQLPLPGASGVLSNREAGEPVTGCTARPGPGRKLGQSNAERGGEVGELAPEAVGGP